MVRHFKKTYKCKREVSSLSQDLTSNNKDIIEDGYTNNSEEGDTEDEDSNIDHYGSSNGQGYTNKKLTFSKAHPGGKFSHLVKLKRLVITQVYIPKGMLCKLEEFKVNNTNASAEAEK